MFSFFKAKNKEVVNKVPEKSHDELVADFTRSQYRDLYPKTREELKEKILKDGCDLLQGEMFMYALCRGEHDCLGEDCPAFNGFFKSECKRLSL